MASNDQPAATPSRLVRIIEAILRQFEDGDRELVVRFRLWKARWFGTWRAEYLGYDEETLDLKLGPWQHVSPTARVLNHTATCSIWRGPFGSGCDCGSQCG